MNKRLVAVAASAFLFGSEAASEIEKFNPREATMDAPHNHVEMAEGCFIDVTSGFSLSGGPSDKTLYYLQLASVYATDADGKQELAGFRAFATPDSGSQQMYAQFDTLQNVISVLGSELGLRKPQLAATRRSLLAGSRTEIGGHGVRRFFSEETMRSKPKMSGGSCEVRKCNP